MKQPPGQTGSAAGPKVGGSGGLDGGPIGAIVLAGSGLITRIDRKAADLLGTRQNEAQGKSFNLFVERSELALFYSHWNKLLSTSENQLFEITLHAASPVILQGKSERYGLCWTESRIDTVPPSPGFSPSRICPP
jgi:PAS domain-containing protein